NAQAGPDRDLLAVRAERQRFTGDVVVLEGADLVPRVGVPEDSRAGLPGPRQDVLAVRAENRCIDVEGHALESPNLRGRDRFPEDRRRVGRPCEQALAVRTEGDGSHITDVPAKGVPQGTGFLVPKDGGVIERAGCDLLAVRAEGDAVNRGTVPRE